MCKPGTLPGHDADDLETDNCANVYVAPIMQAREVIGRWVGRYNDERPHSSLGDKTPTEAYFKLELGSSLGSCSGMSRQGRAA